MYKAFAAAILILAPLLVLAVQAFVPHVAEPVAPVAAVPQPAPASYVRSPPPPETAPESMTPATVPDPSSFSQPLQGAGQPMTPLGSALPDAPEATNGDPADTGAPPGN